MHEEETKYMQDRQKDQLGYTCVKKEISEKT
jgi:hypothetical protein